MYGITFDLNTRDLQMFYSHTEQQAYAEIAEILQNYGFKNMGKVFISQSDNVADLFTAVLALRQESWFSSSVRNIHSFKIEQWSDLTQFVRA
ncbi:virulence factor [Simonsiella muelleri]|jgi:hypothetical protein|uniref:Uncharacterized protein n=1 Tax=Simonsiella muelleri ATCC 29453 TaxID=641147 RepID=V9HJR5_9NEIS|nr:hypothetical protein [Simonsiella muelleri]AUX61242.1 hypothetical protein BWP33_05045 [Simonsiella muelleri ATCC 29453]EFG29861.1 hypothetical protein HMPREF9021_02306 [Simonsiella muelleri ATCC 29453]UBQ53297.1 virulence factor [Simonsiella muelleri]